MELAATSELYPQNNVNLKCMEILSDKSLSLDFPLDMTISNNVSNDSYCKTDKQAKDPLDSNGQFPYYNASQGLQYMCYITNNTSCAIEPDLPEFIDLNDLKVSLDCKNHVQEEVLNLTRCKTDDSTSKSPIMIGTDDDDDADDVIFVTMYSKTAPTVTSTVTSAICGATGTSTAISAVAVSSSASKQVLVKRRRKKKTVVVPRRNPKRVTQLEKASLALAMQLSVPPSIFNAKITKNALKNTFSIENSSRNCRQSCRTTGAILSPPSPLSNKDWKEWPSHGLHHRPVFDPDRVKTKKEPKKSSKSNRDCSSFGVLMHQMLHAGLDYAKDVKEFNKIVNNRRDKDKLDEGAPVNGIKKANDEDLGKNMAHACDLVIDLCRLYCVSNNVEEENLVKYISSLPNVNI